MLKATTDQTEQQRDVQKRAERIRQELQNQREKEERERLRRELELQNKK